MRSMRGSPASRSPKTTNGDPDGQCGAGRASEHRLVAFGYQDPDARGPLDRGRRGPECSQLLSLTCQFGMSAHITGHMGAALAAGQWVQRLREIQPEPSQRLYTIWNRRERLVTSPPEDEDVRHYSNESQETRQLSGGITTVFLAQLYSHTGNDQWLALPRAFQWVSIKSSERQLGTKQVCKSAWRASYLAMVTAEHPYIDWVSRMGEWFVISGEASIPPTFRTGAFNRK